MKYQLLPRLSAEEFASLERSIIAHGVLVPVEYDEAGDIIDGHHRVEICESLGLVDWPKFVRKGLSETDKRTLSRELNFARRHLTTAQKQAVIADQLRDTPSISSRAIAAMLGVHHSTVQSVRKTLVDGGEISHHDEVEGRDGVVQPSRKAIKTAFVPDRDNVGEYMKGAKMIRAQKQKVAHAVRVEHLDMIAKRGEATAPIWWRGGAEGPTYPIILADPPWRHKTWSIETGSEKSADNHYPTMELPDILALGCPATKNAVLFLWVTDLANGIACMKAWGFDYKSFWAWHKVYSGKGHGTGYWSFDNCELLLIGTRGDFPAPLAGTQPQKLTAHPVAAHSAKPDFYAEQLERLWPGVPKLEMFCRSPRPGWQAWGFETGETPPQPISPPEGEMPGRAEGGAVPPADDRPSVTAEELAEFRMLGALADGITASGPLFETLKENGLIWAGRELSVGGAKRLAELGRMVDAASDGDAVNVVDQKKRGFGDALADWTELRRLEARDDLSADEAARLADLKPIVEAELAAGEAGGAAPPSALPGISPSRGENSSPKRRAKKAVPSFAKATEDRPA